MIDPLGFINPVIVTAKIFMQKLWNSKLDWNDWLTSELLIEWNKFINRINQLLQIQILRNYFQSVEMKKIELHGFSDASMKAYGACIHFRIIYNDKKVSCSLITSKSRYSIKKCNSSASRAMWGCITSSTNSKRF